MYQVLAEGDFPRFYMLTTRRYIRFKTISDKYQYRVPNAQYHRIEYRSIRVLDHSL